MGGGCPGVHSQSSLQLEQKEGQVRACVLAGSLGVEYEYFKTCCERETLQILGGRGRGGTDMRRIRRVIMERRGKANDYSFYCVTDMCPRSLSAAGRGAKGVLNVLTRHL